MRKTITSGALVAAVFVHTTAPAQMQDTDQQKCILALNKGMAKVASVQVQADARCTSDFAKGKNADAVSCYSNSVKVSDAQTKNCDAEAKKCVTPPDFGRTSCGTVNNYAELHGIEFASEIFGQADPNAGITLCETDAIACKCQEQVVKLASKLYSTHLKVYNGCKKDGLKDETTPIVDADGLEACLSVDPDLTIDSASIRLADAVLVICAGVTEPFPAGDCAGQVGTALADCVEERVRCRVCRTADASDGLTMNCDDYDDASINASCPAL